MKQNTQPKVPANMGGHDEQEKMRQKVFRLTPAQDRHLKEFCARTDTSIQNVVLEGVDAVLAANGFAPLPRS